MASMTIEVPDEFVGLEPDADAIRQMFEETIDPGHEWTDLGVLEIVARHLRRWEGELSRDSSWFNGIAELVEKSVQDYQDYHEMLAAHVGRDNAGAVA